MLKEKSAVLVCVLASLFAFASCGPVDENTGKVSEQITESVSTTAEETAAVSETSSETTAAETTSEAGSEISAAETTVTEAKSVTETKSAAEEKKVTEANNGTETEKMKSVTVGDNEYSYPAEFDDDEDTYLWRYTHLALASIEQEGTDVTFALIDIDGDDIPEMSVGQHGYWVSLYSFADGRLQEIMFKYGYGVSGNAGYDYIPGQNYMYNANSDYAGLVRYDTYMKINDQHELETVACIEGHYYEDKNGNNIPDEGEEETYTEHGRYFIDGKAISEEEALSYQREGFEPIAGTLTFDEFIKALKESVE